VWSSRGRLLESRHQFSDAIASFSKAIALDPTSGEVHALLGKALSHTNQLEAAAAAHAAAADAFTTAGAPPIQVADQHVSRGRALRQLLGTAGAAAAVDVFQQALILVPSHAEAQKQQMEAQCAVYWEETANAALELQQASTDSLVTLLSPPYRTVTLCSPSVAASSSTAPSGCTGAAVAGSGHNPLYSAHCMHWLDASQCTMLVAAAEAHCVSIGGWGTGRHRCVITLSHPRMITSCIRGWSLLASMDDHFSRING
jgi:tetratricopeptide (TPR) repeat protein